MSKDVEKIKKKIASTLESHDVKRAAVFGSFARGEQNKKSDIDILIKFKKDSDKSLFDLIGLKLDLEEALKRKVDILTYDSIHPLLKNIILKEEKVIL